MPEVMVRKNKREERSMVPYPFPFAFKNIYSVNFIRTYYVVQLSLNPCPAFNPPGLFSLHTPNIMTPFLIFIAH